ncbi:hypothetical protein [Leptospira fletcheri]|nr:hypothetical protein [Leptospira fletcheri]
MTRIFRPNAYFEEELSAGEIFPSGLEAQNAILESCFLVLTGPEKEFGEILSHSLPEERWYEYWKNRVGSSLPTPVRIQKGKPESLVQEPLSLEEWGQISDYSEKIGFKLDPTAFERSARLSSKIKQTEWKKKFHMQEFPVWIFKNDSEWKSHGEILRLQNPPFPLYVRKLEFGFSGRQEFLLPSDLGKASQKDFFKIRDVGSVLEPWMDRTQDFSLLFSAEKGSFRQVASTLLLSNQKGKYSGTWLASEEESFWYSEKMDPVLRNLSDFAPDYTGYGSIDSFVYRTIEGQEELRRVSEINFRWTMGRILWELCRKFPLSDVRDLLLFVSHKGIPQEDSYRKLEEWSREEPTWRIFPLSPFYGPKGKPMPKVLLWFRIKRDEVSDPRKTASDLAAKARIKFGG